MEERAGVASDAHMVHTYDIILMCVASTADRETACELRFSSNM